MEERFDLVVEEEEGRDGAGTAAFVSLVLHILAAIYIARPGLQGLAPAVQLVVEVALGTVVYLAGARLIFRAAASEFIGLLRSSIGRRR